MLPQLANDVESNPSLTSTMRTSTVAPLNGQRETSTSPSPSPPLPPPPRTTPKLPRAPPKYQPSRTTSPPPPRSSSASPLSASSLSSSTPTPLPMPSFSPSPSLAPTPSPTPVGDDVVATVLGNFGIFQLRTVLIIFLCKIPAAWFMACIIFTAPELYPVTEYQCVQENLTANQMITDDQCYIINNNTTTTTGTTIGSSAQQQEEQWRQRCNAFAYDFDFYSVVMQFDLVCIWGSVYLAWTQYWHLFGVLLGGVIGTKMMLRWSPRNVYIVGMIAQIFCGVLTGYARDFSLHCAGRCVSATCCAIMFTAGQAIFVDLTGGLYRIGAIILYDTFWSIGVILLPTLSSFFNSWTHIYLGITFPTLLLMVLLQWTPDAPRWLLRHATSDADLQCVEQIVRKGAHINERTFKIPDDFRQQLEALSKKLKSAPPPARWVELWRGGQRAKTHMIAAHLALAFFVINFMGMLLNIRSFGRDYLVPNTILMGFSEIVGCFMALHFTLRSNKWKWQWAGLFNMAAGLLGCLGWTFTADDTMDATLKVILWMILATVTKAGVSCAQSMILACMNEVMPPPKKQPFVFSVVTWARIWLLSAPFFNVLKVYDTALSLTAYCIFSIIGGICTCCILTPRTAQKNLTTQQRLNAIKALSNGKEQAQSLAAATVWTVENDIDNTRL